MNYVSHYGIKILEEGGNAFDAALGMSSLLTVLFPSTGDLGGDGFLVAKTGGNEIIAYNGSGRSPSEFDPEGYIALKPIRGPLTVTVPGLVDLWEWMHENYGRLEMEELLKKPYVLARDGHYVQEPFFNVIEKTRKELEKFDSWNKTFGKITSTSFVRYPGKAYVFEQIIRRGFREFYEGKIADEIVSELKKQGVPIRLEDFEMHKGEKVELLKTQIEDYNLYELPPNTQGHTTLQILKTYHESALGKKRFEDPERIEEFFKIAMAAYHYRDHNLADPQWMQKDTITLEKELVLKSPVNQRGLKKSDGKDTTFFVVADNEGNLVGFIQSIFRPFGSGIVAKDIIFQSRGSGFAHTYDVPNSPSPNKRPLHTLSILLAEKNERETIIIGCAGGDLRPQIHSNVMINLMYYDMNLTKAVASPRYMIIDWENYIPKTVVVEDPLRLKKSVGNTLHTRITAQTGIVQALRDMKGKIELVADPRSTGVSLPLM